MKNSAVILLLLLTTCLACRLPKFVAPKLMDANFKTMKIDKIGMLPMADLRQDASKAFNNAGYLRKWLGKNLSIRGYESGFTGEAVINRSIASRAEILAYDAKIEQFLGSSSYRFVFLPILGEASNEGFVVGKTSEVSILGVIFDKVQKKVIWMNEAGGEDTSFMALSALSNKLAIDDAIGKLMSGLPRAKK